MNDLQKLAQAVLRELPGAELKMELNAKSGWLDVEHEGVWAVVEWRPGGGFGVSVNEPDPKDPLAYLFEGADEVFQNWGMAKDHLLSLLHSSSQLMPQKRAVQP